MAQTVYNFTSNGTFSVPAYSSIIIELWGPGGGGGGVTKIGSSANGSIGNPTQIQSLSLRANSGFGGERSNATYIIDNTGYATPGQGGVATGGDVNTTGQQGSKLGWGGDAPDGSIKGGSGGFFGKNSPGHAGSPPGGAGSGGNYTYQQAGDQYIIQGAGAGSGAYLKKTYSAGALSGTLQIEVGTGGLAGTGDIQYGSPGGTGECIITVIGGTPQAIVNSFGFP